MSCRVTVVIDGCGCAEAGSLDVMGLRMKDRASRYGQIEIFLLPSPRRDARRSAAAGPRPRAAHDPHADDIAPGVRCPQSLGSKEQHHDPGPCSRPSTTAKRTASPTPFHTTTRTEGLRPGASCVREETAVPTGHVTRHFPDQRLTFDHVDPSLPQLLSGQREEAKPVAGHLPPHPRHSLLPRHPWRVNPPRRTRPEPGKCCAAAVRPRPSHSTSGGVLAAPVAGAPHV